MRTNNEIPDPAIEIPNLPKTLHDFILKACARDPANRYQDIPEALKALNPFIGGDDASKNGNSSNPQRKVRMYYLVYGDDQHPGLRQALDEFNAKVQNLGIELKAGESIDLN